MVLRLVVGATDFGRATADQPKKTLGADLQHLEFYIVLGYAELGRGFLFGLFNCSSSCFDCSHFQVLCSL